MGLAAVFWQARAPVLEPIGRVLVVVGVGDVGLAGRFPAYLRQE
jgi:hypothetical protein